ncbi:uncharacterized protein LOC110877253 [Helianthus annuus]|uniref:uncharacterized protein LOC110877253 n=1 Tax=Helianthus annuus TaxID=4232 RepID=UPI001652F2F9|nr:uncharacterized protein LOC110877253 [Helianthus annuus]
MPLFPLSDLSMQICIKATGNQSHWIKTRLHVEAWTLRLMRLRQSKLLKDPSRKLRWTVLPPQFYEDVCYTKDCLRAVDMAGKKEPYPLFWEVDYLYIPIWIKQEDWLLFRVDIFNMEITQYWTDKRWGNEKRRLVEHVMDIFPIFFKHFLDQIHYWRNSRYCTKKKFHLVMFKMVCPRTMITLLIQGCLSV